MKYAKEDLVPQEEVAAMLGTSPHKIKSGILNGTLPIGCVLRQEGSTRDRIIILRSRLDAWRNAQI